MTKLSIRIASALFLTALAAGPAFAGDAPAADKPAATKAEAKKPAAEPATPAEPGAEVKAAKGVEQREPVEEGTSFTAGTKVWVWSRVTGAKDTRVKHVWKKDGKEIWSTPLAVKSDRWVTHSRRTLSKAGEYTVDVVGADGNALGSVTFTGQ